MNKIIQNEESVSTEIEKLQKEINQLEQEVKTFEKKIRELRDKEDPAQNLFFAQEIFTLQQKKLMLQTEVEFRRNKINRLLFDSKF